MYGSNKRADDVPIERRMVSIVRGHVLILGESSQFLQDAVKVFRSARRRPDGQ